MFLKKIVYKKVSQKKSISGLADPSFYSYGTFFSQIDVSTKQLNFPHKKRKKSIFLN